MRFASVATCLWFTLAIECLRVAGAGGHSLGHGARLVARRRHFGVRLARRHLAGLFRWRRGSAMEHAPRPGCSAPLLPRRHADRVHQPAHRDAAGVRRARFRRFRHPGHVSFGGNVGRGVVSRRPVAPGSGRARSFLHGSAAAVPRERDQACGRRIAVRRRGQRWRDLARWSENTLHARGSGLVAKGIPRERGQSDLALRYVRPGSSPSLSTRIAADAARSGDPTGRHSTMSARRAAVSISGSEIWPPASSGD